MQKSSDAPPPSTKHVPPESGRRKAKPSTTRTTADDARLLPRHREPSPLLERARMERVQAGALLESMVQERQDVVDHLVARFPLRHELTKPGDADALRGIPAIGRSVAGAIPGSNPEQETIKRLMRATKLRERTAA